MARGSGRAFLGAQPPGPAYPAPATPSPGRFRGRQNVWAPTGAISFQIVDFGLQIVAQGVQVGFDATLLAERSSEIGIMGLGCAGWSSPPPLSSFAGEPALSLSKRGGQRRARGCSNAVQATLARMFCPSLNWQGRGAESGIAVRQRSRRIVTPTTSPPSPAQGEACPEQERGGQRGEDQQPIRAPSARNVTPEGWQGAGCDTYSCTGCAPPGLVQCGLRAGVAGGAGPAVRLYGCPRMPTRAGRLHSGLAWLPRL